MWAAASQRRVHAEGYRRVHGLRVRLVGVYSRRAEAATEFARSEGFGTAYGSLEDLLDDREVDLVDACVPNRHHEEIAVQALRAGKHVVVV